MGYYEFVEISTSMVLAQGDSFGSTDVYDLCINAIGLEEVLDLDLKLYPNPVDEELNLLSNEPLNGAQVVIFNSLGQVSRVTSQIEGNQIRIGTSELASGLYILTLILEDGERRKSIQFVRR